MDCTSAKYKITLPTLCNDVLYEIFNHLPPSKPLWCPPSNDTATPLKDLSLVNRRFRELLRPLLWKNVAVVAPQEWNHSDHRGWHLSSRALNLIGSNPLLVTYIKVLKLEPFDTYTRQKKEVADVMVPQLIRFLNKLENLRSLCLRLAGPVPFALKDALTKSDTIDLHLHLPNVTTLVVNTAAAFFLRHCPSLQIFALQTDRWSTIYDHYPSLHNAAKGTPNVTHFEASVYWYHPHVECIASAFPRLCYLDLYLRRSTPIYGDAHKRRTPELLRLLGSLFKRLEILVLPEVYGLELYVFDVPERPWATSRQGWRKAEDRAAGLAFANIASLEEVWVGDEAVARRVRQDEKDELGDSVLIHEEADGIIWLWMRGTNPVTMYWKGRLLYL